MKKQIEKKVKKEVEIPKPKYIKNISDYSQCSILFDEIVDPKIGNSLLMVARGVNPHNHFITDNAKKSQKHKDQGLVQFMSNSIMLIETYLEKNLVLVVSMAKDYTDKDLEKNPFLAVTIVSEMFSEFMLFKKK